MPDPVAEVVLPGAVTLRVPVSADPTQDAQSVHALAQVLADPAAQNRITVGGQS